MPIANDLLEVLETSEPERLTPSGETSRRKPLRKVRFAVDSPLEQKEIRTARPILVFIDRGGRFETNTDGTAPVDVGAFAGDPPDDPRGSISPPSVPP